MAIRVIELFKSRETLSSYRPQQSTATLVYLVKDCFDELDARTAIEANSPSTWDGKARVSIELQRVAKTKHLAKVNYDDQEEDLDTGEWRISFDTAGGTVKQTLAYAERKYPSTAPDQRGAVNVQDGKVQGLDVPIGTLKFTIHYRMPKATITLAYVRTLAFLVGRTNAASFYGFDALEVMFLGAQGQQGSRTDPVIDYSFLAGEHLTNFQVGGITVALKRAHEHLWASFEDTVEGGDEPALIPTPRAIYIDEVARSANFSLLGIGNGT